MSSLIRIRVNGNEIEGTAADIAALLSNLETPKKSSRAAGHAEVSEKSSFEVARLALSRRPLSDSQQRLLRYLQSNDSEWVSASSIREKLRMNGNQLGGVFGALGRRLSSTKGYDSDMSFFDWEWNDAEGEYDCRLRPVVIEALNELSL